MATHTFYDVKTRSKLTVEVVGKVRYTKNNRTRYALKGKTEEGRPLTAFVKESVFNDSTAPELSA
jgi:hypothetical protein